jgi:hypothetical protein
MITIEIEPTGVRRVRVSGVDGLEQDLSLLVWPLVRPHVERLDRQLRRDGAGLLGRLCSPTNGVPANEGETAASPAPTTPRTPGAA